MNTITHIIAQSKWHLLIKSQVKYIDCAVENNNKDPKVEVGDHVKILKYTNIFAKGYAPNWSEKVFVIKLWLKKLKILCHGHL